MCRWVNVYIRWVGGCVDGSMCIVGGWVDV